MSVIRSVVNPVVRSVVNRNPPTVSDGYDVAAIAYFAAVEGAGGSLDSSATYAQNTAAYVKSCLSEFCASLRTAGVLAKLHHLWIAAPAGFTGLEKSIVGGDMTWSGWTASHYTFANGLAGASGRFATAPSSPDSQNWSMGAYVSAVSQSTISTDNGGLTNRLHLYASGATSDWYFQSGGTMSNGNGRGLHSVSTSSANQAVYVDGIARAIRAVTSVIPTGNNYTLNRGGGGFFGGGNFF
jgi:hypothetical protein